MAASMRPNDKAEAVRNLEVLRNADVQRMVDLQGQLLAAQGSRVTFVDVKGIGMQPATFSSEPRQFGAWALMLGNLLEGALSVMHAALDMGAEPGRRDQERGTDQRVLGRGRRSQQTRAGQSWLHAVPAQLRVGEALDLVQNAANSDGWDHRTHDSINNTTVLPIKPPRNVCALSQHHCRGIPSDSKPLSSHSKPLSSHSKQSKPLSSHSKPLSSHSEPLSSATVDPSQPLKATVQPLKAIVEPLFATQSHCPASSRTKKNLPLSSFRQWPGPRQVTCDVQDSKWSESCA